MCVSRSRVLSSGIVLERVVGWKASTSGNWDKSWTGCDGEETVCDGAGDIWQVELMPFGEMLLELATDFFSWAFAGRSCR